MEDEENAEEGKQMRGWAMRRARRGNEGDEEEEVEKKDEEADGGKEEAGKHE